MQNYLFPQKEPQPRKFTRQAIVFHHPNSQQQNQEKPNCTKTRISLCFLCLFDGLRTPTIRRLSRKPRSICNKPLLTFDPSVFAPSSATALSDTYQEALNIPCKMLVDPPVPSVIDMISREIQTGKDRVVIHYYGQGCMAPKEGYLFFFTEDRQKYKPIKLDNLIPSKTAPICMIVDCQSAGIIQPFFKKRQDTIAFFACSPNEQLPISTDAPSDLFSSCLLTPFETAIWWHIRRHSCVFEVTESDSCLSNTFIKQFFFALLETIAFDTQPLSLFETFSKDPAMLALARGFILAQRIMQSFNLHPMSIPELQNTSSNDLWNFWDTALDCSLSMPEEEAAHMIFELFLDSFNTYPSPTLMPLFSYFITVPDFRDEAVQTLFQFLDSHPDITEIAAKSNIPQTIVDMKNPTENTVLLLAKLLSVGGNSPFQQQWNFWYKESADAKELRAGFLAICCAISLGYMSTFTKIYNLCISRAIDCAPYSAILLGLLMERAGRLKNIPPTGHTFLPLLDSPREEDRIGAAYLMGKTKEKKAIDKLIELLHDTSKAVRNQAIIALALIMNSTRNETIQNALGEVQDNDPEIEVREVATLALMNKIPEAENKADLFKMLLDAVKSNGFKERYQNGLIRSD